MPSHHPPRSSAFHRICVAYFLKVRSQRYVPCNDHYNVALLSESRKFLVCPSLTPPQNTFVGPVFLVFQDLRCASKPMKVLNGLAQFIGIVFLAAPERANCHFVSFYSYMTSYPEDFFTDFLTHWIADYLNYSYMSVLY